MKDREHMEEKKERGEIGNKWHGVGKRGKEKKEERKGLERSDGN